MAEKIKELIRDYQEGKISRREFMRQAVLATGSLAAASSMIDMLMPFMARADMVPPNDPDMLTHARSNTRATQERSWDISHAPKRRVNIPPSLWFIKTPG